MLKLVIGSKGKGKTKHMLETANNEAKTSDGLVIYLDKNSKHSEYKEICKTGGIFDGRTMETH